MCNLRMVVVSCLLKDLTFPHVEATLVLEERGVANIKTSSGNKLMSKECNTIETQEIIVEATVM